MEMEVEQEVSNGAQSEACIAKGKLSNDYDTRNGSCSNVRSLEDGLKHFGLFLHFQQFEESLEDVKVAKKSKEKHEWYFEYLDKVIENASIKYRLNLIAKKQDTEEEMVVVLDTVKFVLNVFNRAFIKELDLQNDLGREFDAIYLNQEYKTTSFMCECFFKFCFIKHKNIKCLCSNIREFLKQSQCCVLSFFQNEVNDFKKFQELAVSHLKNCIEEYQDFLVESEMVQNEYNYQNIQSINFLINRMINDSKMELDSLKKIYQMFENSARENFQIFTNVEQVESCFESPFARYINILLMCNLMMNDVSYETINIEDLNLSEPITENDFLIQMNDLATCYMDFTQHESELEKFTWENQMKVLKMKNDFDILLFKMNEKLESSLQIDSYKLCNIKKRFMAKCMNLIDEFYDHKYLEMAKIRNATGESHGKTIKNNYGEGRENSTLENVEQGPDITPDNIKTLEDALKYFGLFSYLNKFSKSLEEVKRNRKTKEDHELLVKQFLKDTQKLSLEYHPDKARSRGYSIEKIEEAQKLQVALNATRRMLPFLNNAFLTDLDIDHKYEFYLKLEISSLGNEEELEKYIFEVLCKISYISEIKQQITGEIRKFLIQGQQCLKSYINEEELSFERYCDSAVHHLRTCTERSKKLVEECRAVVEECKMENMEALISTIENLERESNRQLNILNQLNVFAKSSLEGRFCGFLDYYPEEDYFIKPFVRYTNLIILCNLVAKRENQGYLMRKAKEIATKMEGMFYSPRLERFKLKFDSDYDSIFMRACYLALYYSGDKFYKEVTTEIMKNEIESKNQIKAKFLTYVKDMNDILEREFKLDDYNEVVINRDVREELDSCMKMMASFQEKAAAISKGIVSYRKDTQEMKEEIRKKVKEF